MKFILFAFSFCLLVLLAPSQALAISDPPLFSCLQPIGALSASYSSGVHGIPGDSRTFTGSDQVFAIDQSHVLQCFCPEDSDNGIQSNWWRVNDVPADQLDFFIRRGWVFVPNGQPWGLAEAPYLVKNDSFQCQESGRGGNGSESKNGGGSSNNGSTTSSPTNVGRGGSILGVNSLADTGNAQKILVLYLVGGISALLAYRLGKE